MKHLPWTDRLPTEEGIYWYSEGPKKRSLLVEVETLHGDSHLSASIWTNDIGRGWPLKLGKRIWPGLWAGPLPQPEDHA